MHIINTLIFLLLNKNIQSIFGSKIKKKEFGHSGFLDESLKTFLVPELHIRNSISIVTYLVNTDIEEKHTTLMVSNLKSKGCHFLLISEILMIPLS